jgi:TolB protein
MRKSMKYIIFILALTLISCERDEENLLEIRTDNAIKVTSFAPESSQNPCFSPDGQYLIFTRFLDGYNSGASEIVKIKVDGSAEETIVSASNSNNVNVPFGSWVDNKICFASDRAGLADEIWIVNDDGSHLQQITTHPEEEGTYYIEPVFNPQNTHQIIFEYVTGKDDNTAIHKIAFLDVETSNVYLLTDGTFDDRLPSWSNDGSKIIFQRNNFGQEEGWRVYVANINTNPPASIDSLRVIYFGESEYMDCSWSYDDKYILSSSPFGNDMPNIWLFPLDNNKTPIRKTNTNTNEDGAPSQSHDGNKIAFESHYGDSEEEPSEIWIIK